MTSSDVWHADHDDLERFLDGRVGAVFAASLEAHVLACESCRAQLNAMAFEPEVEARWTGVRSRIEDPAPGAVEAFLRRLGLSQEATSLLAAVPSLRAGWLLGVGISVAFAGLASLLSADLGLTLFLLVAPLAPVAGVAAAFGGDADPSHEIVTTTPFSAGRLLSLRTLAVLASSVPLAVAVGLLLPTPAWVAVAWLGPALAGVTATLALAPVAGLTVSSAVVGVAWTSAVVAADRASDPMALVGTASQLVCVLVIVVASAALLHQRSYDPLGRLS